MDRLVGDILLSSLSRRTPHAGDDAFNIKSSDLPRLLFMQISSSRFLCFLPKLFPACYRDISRYTYTPGKLD